MFWYNSYYSSLQDSAGQLFEVFTTPLNALSHALKPVAEALAMLVWRDGTYGSLYRGTEFGFVSKANTPQLLFYFRIVVEVERSQVW